MKGTFKKYFFEQKGEIRDISVTSSQELSYIGGRCDKYYIIKNLSNEVDSAPHVDRWVVPFPWSFSWVAHCKSDNLIYGLVELAGYIEVYDRNAVLIKRISNSEIADSIDKFFVDGDKNVVIMELAAQEEEEEEEAEAEAEAEAEEEEDVQMAERDYCGTSTPIEERKFDLIWGGISGFSSLPPVEQVVPDILEDRNSCSLPVESLVPLAECRLASQSLPLKNVNLKKKYKDEENRLVPISKPSSRSSSEDSVEEEGTVSSSSSSQTSSHDSLDTTVTDTNSYYLTVLDSSDNLISRTEITDPFIDWVLIEAKKLIAILTVKGKRRNGSRILVS